MCGIAGIASLRGGKISALRQKLGIMDELLAHRGPDGNGAWIAERQNAGLVHRRLSIIDLSEAAAQPMIGANGAVITYNGEIYNYV
jgi:asparagine synthase (glutamine-hydrolysing)